MEEYITVKYKPADSVVTVIVLIDRLALLKLSTEVLGRQLGPDQLDNLEVQIESIVVQMAADMDYFDKEWVEAAIINDDIPA